jgi:hypothetical protein
MSLTRALIATRYITRHKTRQVTVIEAEAQKVDVRTRRYYFASNLTASLADKQDCHVQWCVLTSLFSTAPYAH